LNAKKPYPFYKSDNPLVVESNQLDIFKGKSFLEFNEIIGLPIKNDIEHPIYDYELDLINKIESNRNIWVKKASGIGVTEIVLRYLTWKIRVNDDLEYKSIFIVSGTFVHHANELKVRMENLFRRKFPLIQLQSKFTDLWIKNTNIKIFPSRNVKDLRGYTDVSYLFIDEADMFEPSVNSELLHAITRYEEKSHCTTIMVSTPNAPGGLFESIEKDPDSKYTKIFLDYTIGLDKIFNRAEIEQKKKEPEFPREYMLQYLGKVGNLLLPSQIQTCISLGQVYSINKIPVSLYTLKSVGIDPGFSSSATGIVVLEHIKPRAMVNLLKIRYNEPFTGWETKTSFGPNTKIRPVNFSTEHRNMLSNLHTMISKGYLAIEEKHQELITSLRTAYAEELNLKKGVTSYDDLLDALRLSLKGYNIK
jgi:hypothetical protein